MSELNRAYVKQVFAEAGLDVHPDAKVKFLDKPTTDGPVIILDRAIPDETPDYCVHGYATCVRCDHPCWLGSETAKVVTAGKAYALCRECVRVLVMEGVWPTDTKRIGHIDDHRRADGPH